MSQRIRPYTISLSEPSRKLSEVSDLQEICLYVITEKFWKYHAVWNLPNREDWRFFVRFYTRELFQRLKKQWKLFEPQHMDILINPYLKELDLEWINPNLYPSIIEKLKTVGSTILSVKSSFMALRKDLEEKFYEPFMSSLPNVEKIDFAIRSSVVCKPIGRHCVRLKHLKLCPREMDKNEKRVCNEGVAFIISHCPLLLTVEYNDTVGALYDLHKDDLPALDRENGNFEDYKKYALKSLSSKSCDYPLREALYICSVTCPHVSDLHIDYLNGDAVLEKVSHFTMLEKVVFRGISDVTVSCFNQFLSIRGSKLTSLEMPYHSCLSVAALIGSCPTLKSLKFHTYSIPQANRIGGDKELSGKSLLSHLETLLFRGADFRHRGAATALNAILSAAENVKILSLRDSSGLINEFVAGLNLCSVHDLDLRLTDVEVYPLRRLISYGNLKKLNIQRCRNITDEDYFTLTMCLPEDARNTVSIEWSPLYNRTMCLIARVR